MQPTLGDPDDDEWILLRIFPGSWVEAEDRPYASEFKVVLAGERAELGISAYIESEVELAQVLPKDQRSQGFGLVRLHVRAIREIDGLFVVRAPDPLDPVTGSAHVEIRAVSPAGGKQISNSRRDKLARLAVVVQAASSRKPERLLDARESEDLDL